MRDDTLMLVGMLHGRFDNGFVPTLFGQWLRFVLLLHAILYTMIRYRGREFEIPLNDIHRNRNRLRSLLRLTGVIDCRRPRR